MIQFNDFPDNIEIISYAQGPYEAYENGIRLPLSSYDYDKFINKIHITLWERDYNEK